MANKGVYSREDDSPESVGRSVQTWNQQKSIDARFMEIYPTYHDILYPNEVFRIKPSMFVRTIPMVAPVLSHIRIVTRFYAIPIRILWQPWERYIDISNEDYDFTLEEPYLVNATSGRALALNEAGSISGLSGSGVSDGRVMAKVSYSSHPSDAHPAFINARQFSLVNGKVPNDFGKRAATDSEANNMSYVRGGLYVFPHDLLDYFDAPIGVDISPFVDSSGSVTANSVRFNAYKAAAYQLAYSFGYRMPNVQKRVDDFYEMASTDDYEYPPALYGTPWDSSDADAPDVATIPTLEAASYVNSTVKTYLRKARIASYDTIGSSSSWNMDYGAHTSDNLALSSDSDAVLRTSWDKTEIFPLKAGANATLQAWRLNSYGSLEFVPSNISLFRKRFANWQMDYFTSSNPWQQRGTEAQIPVSGDAIVTLPSGAAVTLAGAFGIPALRIVNGRAFTPDGGVQYGAGEAFLASGSAIISGTNATRGVAFYDVNTGTIIPGALDTHVRVQTEPKTATAVFSGTADLSAASGSISGGLYVSPSNFRFAMALQKIKEMSARTDGRYMHYLSKFFGSFVHDDRIDYPEFLGGMVQDLNVDVVTQTSESGSTDLGSLAGNGVSAKSGYEITYHAKEHTILLALTHIVPEARYNGGLDRQDNCADPYDWMLPQFSGLSEQPVYNYELACGDSWDASGVNRSVFGYEPYLNYLRGKPSRANGAFRDSFDYTGSYEYYKPWIIQRDFGKQLSGSGSSRFLRPNVPTLSDKFLSGRGTTDNSMFNVADDRLMYPFIIDSAFAVRATRNIPSRGIPHM